MPDEVKPNEDVIVGQRDDVIFIKRHVKYNDEPLGYATPKFNSGADADKFYGAEEVGNMITQFIAQRLAQKVTNNKLPRNVTDQVAATTIENLKKGDPTGQNLIYTVDEAAAYRPGEREPGAKETLNNILSLLADDSAEINQEQLMAQLRVLALKKAKSKRTKTA